MHKAAKQGRATSASVLSCKKTLHQCANLDQFVTLHQCVTPTVSRKHASGLLIQEIEEEIDLPPGRAGPGKKNSTGDEHHRWSREHICASTQ